MPDRRTDSRQRLLVVVPAWNEAGSIADVIAEIRCACPRADLLVVDDGSGDATGDVAVAAGAAVCRLPYNLGVGGAMRAGYRFALRERYDAVVQIDADGQHDPGYVETLLAELDRCDVAIGARFAGEGQYTLRGPRRWAMVLLAATLSRIARHRLTDVTSGFRAANRRAIAVFATHYPAEYLGDTVESLVIAMRTGCTVRQVPVAMRSRAAGRASQGSLSATIYLMRAVVALGMAVVRRWPTAMEQPPREDR